jgi:signal transduction histidine kinase
MWPLMYDRLLKARSKTEDEKRQELILNILLLGTVVLSVGALISAVSTRLLQGAHYNGVPPILLLVVSAIFFGFYRLSRAGHYKSAAYSFVTIFFVFSTYPIVIWGILLPQAILTYSLIIVMSGVLLGSRAAFRITALLIISLLVIEELGSTRKIHFNTTWLKTAGGYNDVFVYGFTFIIIAVVAWLSNREIERSLTRARQSEKELRLERNSLEVKVRERTKELEKAQVEKMLELHRFAEFGRFSSTLLHDLANPLTSASLELEQLATTRHAQLVQEARKSIESMERYVDGARRQLRNESEIKRFNVSAEIGRVKSFLESKAKSAHVTVEYRLDGQLFLYGDSIRFNQIMANLIANAIDAYEPVASQKKTVQVITKQQKDQVIITVVDNGVGIHQDKLDHIFEAFYTTKEPERGSGLGLAITKQAVEVDFNGTIQATSSNEKGTRFTVSLPLA